MYPEVVRFCCTTLWILLHC